MDATSKTPAERLLTPVQYLKGVGPARAQLLERLGLRTARDLLFYFPRDYQDLTDLRPVEDLEEGGLFSVLGTVADVELQGARPGRSVLAVLVREATGDMRGVWFNQPFLRERFAVGQQVMLSGKATRRRGYWQMVHPRVEWFDGDEQEISGKLLPVYSLTEGLSQGHLRKATAAAIELCSDALEETFAEEYLREHDLWPLRLALPEAHFPSTNEALRHARRRLVYSELLVLQLALSIKRRQRQQVQALPLAPTAKINARIERLFPFELTAAQRQAIDEVSGDMAQSVPMNRLLQGDVGSGKTVVAVYAMLLAVAHGAQAALMAPTEVLARQHERTLSRMLAASQVRRGLLTGGMTAAARRDLLAQIAEGEIDLVVGTQAMLQGDVEFKRLGLVVIDEQHKFGVRQRAALKRAGLAPHYLVMTATPIPRTVLMALFGDLDVSTLRDAPPGRQPVHTYLAPPEQHARWWSFFRKKLREGRQGYVVVPLVEQSEAIEARSLAEMYESLANGELEAFRLGLIHGRMTSIEKEAAMEAFRRGETQVLVSTTVVEVGVDVPNATLMTIEGAERFGLSQLHQLRGRITRGVYPGYCCVLTEGSDDENDESRRRLDAFAGTTDGFKLAEIDFELRGPGDLLGTKQHGLPELLIADLRRDAELLAEARRDALALVESDPGLARPEHARLRKLVLSRYGETWELGDVG